MQEKESWRYVMFRRIPRMSFQTIKSMMTGEVSEYYENLIQVNVYNETYIFDLDDDELNEINFLHRMDQLNGPEIFVNTGTNN